MKEKGFFISRVLRVFGATLIVIGLLFTSFIQEVNATPQGKVTICHAAGLDGTTKFVNLTLNANAVYGPAGHFKEPGTPNAGHEDDYEGPCRDEDSTLITICYLGQTLEIQLGDLGEYVGYEEGPCEGDEKVTICYEGQTMEVSTSELDQYNGYTEGQCDVPDTVTICYQGESIQVDRSELDKYPGYSMNGCVLPETISICYRGVRMTVLVADLGDYPGYYIENCPVKEEDPKDEPEDEIEELSIPAEATSGLLIPVTGDDLNNQFAGKDLIFSLLGFGLVITGLGLTYKGFKK